MSDYDEYKEKLSNIYFYYAENKLLNSLKTTSFKQLLKNFNFFPNEPSKMTEDMWKDPQIVEAYNNEVQRWEEANDFANRVDNTIKQLPLKDVIRLYDSLGEVLSRALYDLYQYVEKEHDANLEKIKNLERQLNNVTNILFDEE